MTFPYEFHPFGHTLPAHGVMEVLAYTCGSQLYFYLRRRASPLNPGPRLPIEQNLWLIVGCVFGALVGAKVLAWVESYPDYWAHRGDPAAWLGGKTIAGGLLGGWAGVEVAKKFVGVRRSTGDLFVFPLIVGICLGRVGCFLTGLADHTCGARTSVPWAVDFGDGPRHPNQLYEIAAALLIGIALLVRMRRPWRSGQLFRVFLAGYLAFRFGVEFIHWPRLAPYMGLSAIQVACLGGIVALAFAERRSRRATAVVAATALPTEAVM